MKNTYLLLFLLPLLSCYQAPDIDGFDTDRWTQSLEACNSYRMETSTKFFVGRESKLLTISQNELQELLGTPDEHQLFNRNQKFFFYTLNCEESKRLAVRFDALGRVKEVTIEKMK